MKYLLFKNYLYYLTDFLRTCIIGLIVSMAFLLYSHHGFILSFCINNMLFVTLFNGKVLYEYEKDNITDFLLSMPVDKKSIVLSEFISMLFIIPISALISSFPLLISNESVNFNFAASVCGIWIIFLGVFLFLFFCFGYSTAQKFSFSFVAGAVFLMNYYEKLNTFFYKKNYFCMIFLFVAFAVYALFSTAARYNLCKYLAMKEKNKILSIK